MKTTGEPLAIVGMAFQFPQDVSTESDLWKLLLQKRNAMTEYPKDRINIYSFYHPESSRTDTIPFRGGHFLTEFPSAFDAPFFSITAAEAEAMDPQHRLALETTFHALESAGIPMGQLAGTKTSVHAGSFSEDYKRIVLREPDKLPSHAGSGLALTMLSNRISWFFDFQGPSMTVDTACSSSMTALDLSCQGLRSGDADIGIIAGANLIYGLELPLMLSNMNFLSPDSRCYSFDQRANGYGRGEGIAVLVVKRLSDALSANDTIRAIIRATGCNSDGRTPGITQPSLNSQEKLIKATYAKAALEMDITAYVEAHGTGTAVGDPIEATAIGNAFKDSGRTRPMYIGSVKSNLGHLEGCSSLAGVIKAVLMLENGVLAPNADFQKLNSSIDPALLNIEIVADPTPWPTRGLRRASISSFGFGGANSHIVLDDAYNYLRLHDLQGNHCTVMAPPTHDMLERKAEDFVATPPTRRYPTELNGVTSDHSSRRRILLLTASDQDGVQRIADGFGNFAKAFDTDMKPSVAGDFLDNLVYTLHTRRTLLNWRSYTVVKSLEDWKTLSQNVTKPVKRLNNARIAYAFTGQGAQHAAMADGLLQFPVAVDSLQRSEMCFDQLGAQWSLMDQLFKPKDPALINEPELSQPLCTAIQLAIFDLLRSLGLAPQSVVGHSSGEIAAAYSIGAISHASACKIAYHRGQCAKELIQAQKKIGRSSGMMSVGLSEEEFSPYFSQLAIKFGIPDVVVACINSPKSITASGNMEQIDWLKDKLYDDGVFARKLRVSIAYHSPLMQEIAGKYLERLGRLDKGTAISPIPIMISSVTGDRVTLQTLQEARYWVDNMVMAVRFSDALTTAYYASPSNDGQQRTSIRKSPFHDVLEIGPHATLRGPILDILRNAKVGYLFAMNRSFPCDETLFDLVGKLFCRGYDIDISKINFPNEDATKTRKSLPHLPKYPFDHSRHYWHESRASKEGYRLRKHPRLDLLGAPAPDWNFMEPRWRCVIRGSESPWVLDHRIKGSILYPASGMVAMALEAVNQMVPEGRQVSGYMVKDMVFARSIVIPDESEEKEVDIVLRPPAESLASSEKHSTTWEVKMFAREADGEWQEKCAGMVSVQYQHAVDAVDEGREASSRRSRERSLLTHAHKTCEKRVDHKRFYSALKDMEYVYGPSFQAISNLKSDGAEVAVADIAVHRWQAMRGKATQPQKHIIHPVTLDAMFQVAFLSAAKGHVHAVPPMLPSRLSSLWIAADGISQPNRESTSVYTHSEVDARKVITDGFAVDPETRETILSIQMESTLIETRETPTDSKEDEGILCYQILWEPDIDLMDNESLSRLCQGARPTERLAETRILDQINTLIYRLGESADSAHHNSPAKPSQQTHDWTKWASQVISGHPKGTQTNGRQLDGETSTDLSTPSKDSAPPDQSQDPASSDLLNLYTQITTSLSSLLDPSSPPQSPEHFPHSLAHLFLPFAPISRLLQLLSHKTPDLSVLELNAGSSGGAFTEKLIETLTPEKKRDAGGSRKFSRYDCTDPSAEEVENLRGKLQRKSEGEGLRFEVFDTVERENGSGGSRDGMEGAYDFVFATELSRETGDVEGYLRRIRRLVKPGGMVVLVEAVVERARRRFALGLRDDGWNEGLKAEEWDGLLRRTGFSGVDVEIPDFEEREYHEYSCIVSRAVDEKEVQWLVAANRSVSIIVDEGDGLQARVAESLKSTLYDSGFICDLTSWSSISRDKPRSEHHWICLSELSKPFLANISEPDYNTLKSLLQSARSMLWVTGGGGEGGSDPRLHIIDGFARTVSSETPTLSLTTVALDLTSAADRTPASLAEKITRILHRQTSPTTGPETEYLEREGNILIPRAVPALESLSSRIASAKPIPRQVQQPFGSDRPLSMVVGSPGLLDTLHFVDDDSALSTPLPPDHVEVRIHNSGVNFRDCLTALGRLEVDWIGVEYSGVVTQVSPSSSTELPSAAEDDLKPGDRVVGWCHGSYRSLTRNPRGHVMRLPGNVSLTDAAASMVVFITAWHCFANVAGVRRGEKVLIHSAAGGTGQAAIQVARHLGAEVFVTVGSVEKREFLRETYGIPEERVFASRDLTFREGIMRETGGRGVDVVLNSLSGESLLASWDCVAPFGRFVEIGVRDITRRAQLPMWQFRNACSFTHVSIDRMMVEQPEILMDVCKTVFGLLSKGVFFVPKPLRVFGISEVQKTFRMFQGGNNYGRMVVEMRPDDLVDARLKPLARYKFDANRTYIIVGGLGGLGRSIAQWMVDRGARNLILLSRSGAATAAAQETLKSLAAKGARVLTPKCDVSDQAVLQRTLEECSQTLPPVAGCIQAAMSLQNDLFEKLSYEGWKTGTGTKIQGTWNLHRLLPSGLDFFVCFSSLACVIGSVGQVNYAAGNSYMDELVRYRVSQGEAATTINLGWVENEGVVADNSELRAVLARVEAMFPVSMMELFAVLDWACDPGKNKMQHHVILGLQPPKNSVKDYDALISHVPWIQRRPFAALIHDAKQASRRDDQAEGTGSKVEYADLFRSSANSGEAVEVVRSCVRNRLSKALAVEESEIDMSLPFYAIGIDSLFGVELRNYLAKQFDTDVAVFDLMGASSVEAACTMAASRSRLRK